ncbi:MAG: hypothetical protein R6V44_17160, partial [Paracoccaceae bacterium]
MTPDMQTPRRLAVCAALAATLGAGPASAASLEASYSMNPPDTPPGVGSEFEDRLRTDTAPFAEISNTYAFGFVRTTVLTGPEFYSTPDDPGLVVGEFENAVIEDYDEARWLVSASARAARDELRAEALSRQLEGFEGASATAEAQSKDVLGIGGAGDGTLTMDFVISGSASASVRPEFFGDDLEDVLSGEGVGFRFAAELGNGFDVTRVGDGVRLGGSGIDVRDTTSFGASARDRVLTLTREVVAGETLDFEIYARAFVNTQKGRGRAYADFGSTARISSVSLSDGLTLSSESGFDYLALSAELSEPEP